MSAAALYKCRNAALSYIWRGQAFWDLRLVSSVSYWGVIKQVIIVYTRHWHYKLFPGRCQICSGFAPINVKKAKILAVETFIIPAHAICQRCNTGSTLSTFGNYQTATDSNMTKSCQVVSWAEFAKMMVQFMVCTLIRWTGQEQCLIHKWLCLISLSGNF